ESNHEMVNALTQQMGTIFTPMINNTNQSYEILARQVARIADFFGAPPQQNLSTPQGSNVRVVETPRNGEQIEQEIPRVVQRHQDADQVLRNIQQDVNVGHNNISNVVEQILVQNGINVGLHRPNFVSPLSEYVRQTELPRGWKIPKFTKFAGETGESTVEHIARFQTEAGELANNENLKVKYFPSSLTKNAFTWFTTLPPQSVFSWSQLERLFHEQFYMGQSKISLKELAGVRRKGTETVDDYLNRFRLLKARYTQHLRDMAQLANRVRQVERLKAEKARVSKYHKKEKIAYVTTNEFDSDSDSEYEEGEVNVAELKPGPPYICKLLKPSKDKNPIENKNDKFSSKTYSFDITKCDEIFDLLVTDGQIIVPPRLKNPPLEQKNKRGFCKFHNFLGHKTSQCVLFRDLVQKALKEGRLQFGEKPKSSMQVDTDPLQVVADFIVDHGLVELSVNLVDQTNWKLFFYGSSHKNGSGIGVLIISPEGLPTKFHYRMKDVCSNNEVEYEALITGLKALIDLGAKRVEIRGDSELKFIYSQLEFNDKTVFCLMNTGV
ncbi:uncharacterized protein LOC131652365, partial [Vicia villosa]|uniref:uncharacterized protein LOC131652365 n=1 Tax=Vicia villosa TaxID=3911 RepID=UPI00273C81C0